MKQLLQKLRNGQLSVLEVPRPNLINGEIVVQVHYSLISSGTEGTTVSTARKNLIEKARERPQQVKQVLDVLTQQGPVQAYRAVMKKLDAYSPLGYSCAGVVLAVGAGVAGFAAGDRIACAGAGYANHAEIVAVPANLCVRLAPDADLKRAAYNTLGAIALQGIRQADVRLGESCAVIGLGLIGQLTGLMLRAAGVRVAGIDVDPAAVAVAAAHSADLAAVRDTAGIEGRIMEFSGGPGVDAVIITAGTDSLDPVNFAGAVCRKKGRVVVVGAVPTGFDRDPHYYRKELDLRMSCSYGPGRYDPRYEEQGVDYPPAYVRWTEQRNMAAFQELVHSGKIDLDYLTTHEFPLDEAPAAYDLILERREPVLGVVIRYDTGRSPDRAPIQVAPPPAAGRAGIAFIGAGNYAQGNLLPNLPDDPAVARHGVFDASGPVARRVAERFGFSFCAGEARDILDRAEINTVFITTRHDSHAAYVAQVLRAGKNACVEKPLALNDAELDAIAAIFSEPASRRNGEPAELKPLPLLMVGFNRRFAPLARQLKESLRPGPMAILYRVNAGAIPADHWIQDPAVGGGRIIGEACHFVDFLTFLCGAVPVRVHAAALPDPAGLGDTLHVNLEFADGSVGTIAYLASGSKSLFKEYVEVHQHGTSAVLRDFKQLELFGGRRVERKKLLTQDKGQRAMLAAFLDAVKDGRPSPIPLAELLAVTRATFRIVDSARARAAVAVGPPRPAAPEPAGE